MSEYLNKTVELVETHWPDALPVGTVGTVVDDVDGERLWVDFPGYTIPDKELLEALYGPASGWPVLTSEVRIVSDGVAA